MLYLKPNTGAQKLQASVQEAMKFLDVSKEISYSYLIVLTSQFSSKIFAFIPPAHTSDTERKTTFQVVNTSAQDPINGKILLEDTGMYSYEIYYQKGTTNLTPTDSDVFGILDKGMLICSDEEETWLIPAITIPNNVVYYE